MSKSKKTSPVPIKMVLERKRYTQALLAEESGYSESYISLILNGHRQPSVVVYKIIAGVLGMSMDRLLASIEAGT